MSDVENYIKQRKLVDSEFADNFESGYLNFKLVSGQSQPFSNPYRKRNYMAKYKCLNIVESVYHKHPKIPMRLS